MRSVTTLVHDFVDLLSTKTTFSLSRNVAQSGQGTREYYPDQYEMSDIEKCACVYSKYAKQILNIWSDIIANANPTFVSIKAFSIYSTGRN